MGLVRDNIALAAAGYQPGAAAFDLLAAVPPNANSVVAESAVNRWREFYPVLDNDSDRAALAAELRKLWLPRLQALGFEPRDGEQLVDANLRSALIAGLGEMGDPTVLEQARGRFARLANDPKALDGPLKTTWLNIVARNATAADWELLSQLAERSTSSVEKAAYYELLGAAKDRALAQKALDFALTGKAGTTSAAIITSVARANPDLAYDFTIAHRQQAEALVDDSGKPRFYQRLVGTSVDPAMVGKLETLGGALPADQRTPIDQALASLKDRLETYPRRRTSLHSWLAEHAGGAPASQGAGERG
jgi:aminopeptidase N